MAFTGNFMATSFKQELLEGAHDFRVSGGDTFKLALYTNDASFTAATTAFTATNEVPDSGAYVSGGGDLTRVSPTIGGTTAFTDFADISFSDATITARGAMIYNSTPAHTYTNPTVAILDFGSDKTSTSGTFTVQFPTADAANAVLRIA
jgi:hypothetical protein